MSQNIDEKRPIEKPVEGEASNEEKNPQLEVRYAKSGSFRAVRADGVYGGVLPNLNIHMSFFVERGPIPNKVNYLVSQDGKIQEEASVDIEGGIVREVETTVIMDLANARSFLDWLKAKVDLSEALQKGTTKKEENHAAAESDRFEQS